MAKTVCKILGVIFLTYLGVICWVGAIKAARASTENEISLAPAPSLRGGYITGLLMTLLNPMTLGFWFVAVPRTYSVPVPFGASSHLCGLVA